MTDLNKMKTCLNCRYEPDWSEPQGREYSRRMGDCKLTIEVTLPACYRAPMKQRIERYSDDSGVHHRCKYWEPKI